MKRLFNGKILDSDEAEIIANWSTDLPTVDLKYEEATLYKSSKGQFFLVGEGGPGTQFRKELGRNSWTSGEALIPLTPADALFWCESKNVDPDMVSEHFDLPLA